MSVSSRTHTLVSDVSREISQMIITGKYKPGDFLPPHKELAAQMGVGASTIREAVQVLAGMGLLESHPGRGTWVRGEGLDSLIHPAAIKARLGELHAWTVYETRLVIEVPLTQFAAKRATAPEIARIWAALAAMEASQDLEEFVRADLEFHLAVATASHNDLLKQFYLLSRDLLAEVIAELLKLPNVKEDAINVQRAIAAAIERHDAEGARLAALQHMGDVGRLLDMVSQRPAE
jgi:GntR family transcriptional regulator, transcriptional repressor for pyruvate dehydrogenase complex